METPPPEENQAEAPAVTHGEADRFAIWLFLVISVASMVYFTFFYDTTITGPDGAVQNFGLIGRQICGTICSTAVFLVSVILLVAGTVIKRLAKTP